MPAGAIARHDRHAPGSHTGPLRQLAETFNRILDTPAPADRVDLGHLSISQLDRRIAASFDAIAATGLRAAEEHGVTGAAADQAVADLIARVRIRLEARIAEDYLNIRAQRT